jgi:hypothetical protein
MISIDTKDTLSDTKVDNVGGSCLDSYSRVDVGSSGMSGGLKMVTVRAKYQFDNDGTIESIFGCDTGLVD